MLYTKAMKNLVSDSFAEDRRSVSWGRLVAGVLGLATLGLVVWIALSDPSVTTVRVIQPIETPSFGESP